MKAMICLVCVAIAATTAGKMTFGAKSIPQPTPPQKQQVRVVDNTPFRVRWEPMHGQPPMQDKTHEQRLIPVRTERIVVPREPQYMPPPAVEPDVREPVRSPQRRNVRYAMSSERSICIRHRMRTVYMNGGRSWRCRR